MWCVAKLDEEYIQRMEDVLALYEGPFSEQEPVVCIDEKPVVLHRDIRAPQPARPGRLARSDYERKRCGTANLFCRVEPKAGRHFPKATPTRSAAEFAGYLVEVVARYPRARTIHLVLNNLNTYGRKALTDRYGEKLGGLLWERFTVHYTPKHGSWLSQAEIEVGLFSSQCLGKRRVSDLATLCHEVRAWGQRLNRDDVTIQWNFFRQKARKKVHYSITRTRYWYLARSKALSVGVSNGYSCLLGLLHCSGTTSPASPTVVYGPVRTVVWQGPAGDCSPYADQTPQAPGTFSDPGQPAKHKKSSRKSDFRGVIFRWHAEAAKYQPLGLLLQPFAVPSSLREERRCSLSNTAQCPNRWSHARSAECSDCSQRSAFPKIHACLTATPLRAAGSREQVFSKTRAGRYNRCHL